MEKKYIELTNLIVYDITNCTSEWSVSLEAYTFHRIYYVYSGEAYYSSEDEHFILKKNALYIFPVNKPYAITHNQNTPLHCLWFHVNLNYVLLNNSITIEILDFTEYYYIIRTLEKLVATYVSPYIITHVLNALVGKLNFDKLLITTADNRFDKLFVNIHQNYNHTLSNSYLASLINLDQRYFIKLFRCTYGITPQEYIANYRAFQASILLMKGMSVKEVAMSVGFQDPKAFSRFFNSRKGMSPSQFKNSYYLQP